MQMLNFDGRVAVVTGAGRGLGRAYALLLASKGAKVVVNDPGSNLRGEGADTGPAEDVVKEIRAADGVAVACTESVATPQGGKAIIQAALDHYGRIDILIHNAGILRRTPVKEGTYEDFEAVLDVHLRGAFHVVRPAFPLMCQAGYGRIVLVSSDTALYGNYNGVNYTTAKGGIIGLSNTVALEGAPEGVKCNVILPGAVTRMAEGAGRVDLGTLASLKPEAVAPLVGWLAHESCTVTGEMLIAVGGRVARAFTAESAGVFCPSWTIERVAEQINAIRDPSGLVVFPVVPSGHLDHLRYALAMAEKD